MSIVTESENDMFLEIAKRVYVLTTHFAGNDPLNCKKMQGVALQLREIKQSRNTNSENGSL